MYEYISSYLLYEYTAMSNNLSLLHDQKSQANNDDGINTTARLHYWPEISFFIVFTIILFIQSVLQILNLFSVKYISTMGKMIELYSCYLIF